MGQDLLLQMVSPVLFPTQELQERKRDPGNYQGHNWNSSVYFLFHSSFLFFFFFFFFDMLSKKKEKAFVRVEGLSEAAIWRISVKEVLASNPMRRRIWLSIGYSSIRLQLTTRTCLHRTPVSID